MLCFRRFGIADYILYPAFSLFVEGVLQNDAFDGV
jgi:hypothetical protein